MNRYNFLTFVGLTLVAPSVLWDAATPWSSKILLILTMVIALVSASIGLLIVTWVVYAVFSIYVAGVSFAGMAFILGASMVFAFSNVRCPRCQINVGISGGMWKHSPVPHYCIACGRTRRNVWPFQYVFKPEPWDGEYHDEGGGPAREGFHADVIRRQAHDHWRKRQRVR